MILDLIFFSSFIIASKKSCLEIGVELVGYPPVASAILREADESVRESRGEEVGGK